MLAGSAARDAERPVRVGILGYGLLGQQLAAKLLEAPPSSARGSSPAPDSRAQLEGYKLKQEEFEKANEKLAEDVKDGKIKREEADKVIAANKEMLGKFAAEKDALAQQLASASARDAPPARGSQRAAELAFVWARDASKLAALPAHLIVADLAAVARAGADIVVEVAHPDVIAAAGAAILLGGADLLVGSPTAFADEAVENALHAAAPRSGARRLLVPAGALWGAVDIARLGDAGRVAKLTVTMRKHPASLQLRGPTARVLAAGKPSGAVGDAWTVYDGPVRALARDAPNNVNTMAAAALAVPALGFDGVRGVLVADETLDAHVVVVEVEGPRAPGGGAGLSVRTERVAPAPPGAVTSMATVASFWASVRAAVDGFGGRGGVVMV
jgi:predicted dinucleotide-utilizing enzyme